MCYVYSGKISKHQINNTLCVIHYIQIIITIIRIEYKMTINNNNIDDIQQNNTKMSKAHIRASAKYTKKAYKQKMLYIKVADFDKINTFLNNNQQTCTQYFYDCLKRDGVID